MTQVPGWFEPVCVAVVVLTLALMARRRSAGALLGEYLALALAAWIGEASCVNLYRHYGYAASWHGHLLGVPLLVPLIWPLVVLSSREVVQSLWPAAGRRQPLLVGLLVAFDASLVEVIAVRAGLWSWVEPGYLGVPPIGILGWGFFAAGATWALALPLHAALRLVAAVLAGPVVAHALILATWWGLFRWLWRFNLGPKAVWVFAVFGGLFYGAVMAARRHGRVLPMGVAGPRVVAAVQFVVLMAVVALGGAAQPTDGPRWLHLMLVAAPYLAATRFSARGTGSPAAPP